MTRPPNRSISSSFLLTSITILLTFFPDLIRSAYFTPLFYQDSRKSLRKAFFQTLFSPGYPDIQAFPQFWFPSILESGLPGDTPEKAHFWPISHWSGKTRISPFPSFTPKTKNHQKWEICENGQNRKNPLFPQNPKNAKNGPKPRIPRIPEFGRIPRIPEFPKMAKNGDIPKMPNFAKMAKNGKSAKTVHGGESTLKAQQDRDFRTNSSPCIYFFILLIYVPQFQTVS